MTSHTEVITTTMHNSVQHIYTIQHTHTQHTHTPQFYQNFLSSHAFLNNSIFNIARNIQQKNHNTIHAQNTKRPTLSKLERTSFVYENVTIQPHTNANAHTQTPESQPNFLYVLSFPSWLDFPLLLLLCCFLLLPLPCRDLISSRFVVSLLLLLHCETLLL